MSGIKVITTQLCPVYKTNPKKAAGGSSHSIAAGQEIEVESLAPMKFDLILVTGPENLYPSYLGLGFNAYIEPEHVVPANTPPAGNATLNGIMAQVVENGAMLKEIKAKLGIV